MESREIKLAQGTLRAYMNAEVLKTIVVGGAVLSTISTQNILGSVILGGIGVATSYIQIKSIKNVQIFLKKLNKEGKTWTLEQTDNEATAIFNGLPKYARIFSNMVAGGCVGAYLAVQEQSVIKTCLLITSLLYIEESLRCLYLCKKVIKESEKVKTLK